MQVEIDHQSALDTPLAMQVFECDHQAIEGAEALAVIGMRVMEAAAQRAGNPVVEGGLGGIAQGAACVSRGRIRGGGQPQG